MTAQVLSPVTSKSILRTAKDELADTQERSENLRKGLYTEWPNEAGVSKRHCLALPPLFTLFTLFDLFSFSDQQPMDRGKTKRGLLMTGIL
jgi:hypothetical protein